MPSPIIIIMNHKICSFDGYVRLCSFYGILVVRLPIRLIVVIMAKINMDKNNMIKVRAMMVMDDFISY